MISKHWKKASSAESVGCPSGFLEFSEGSYLVHYMFVLHKRGKGTFLMRDFELNRLQEIYDGFSADYDRGRALFDNRAQLEMLAAQIPSGADVLDAGCGSGNPVLRFFAEQGFSLTGTDISPAMLRLAAKQVPNARLVVADTAALGFDEDSFDLITSFYSLFHLEMEKQNQAFEHFFRMLRSDGLAYFTLASEEYTGSPEFRGTRMFAGVELPYSHVRPEAYRRLLEGIGFRIEELDHRSVGGETMLWVLVSKPA